MIPNILKILTFLVVLTPSFLYGQEIWSEHFDVAEKGIWGNENGSIESDFSGITKWTLEYAAVQLNNADDYAKTVSTSGGRFECRDIDGEITWKSEIIDISAFESAGFQLNVSETGSGENPENKYLKVYYSVDNEELKSVEKNALNSGNWGSVTAEQTEIKGNSLQIIIQINSSYSADKIIIDEVIVSGKAALVPVLKNDVLINEVLFNPFPEACDFVEIYNHSDKEIPINQLFLASRDKNFELTQIYPLSDTRKILKPREYLSLCADTNGVFPWFTILCPACFCEMAKVPSFNNDEDFVVLLNEKLEVVDEFFYTEKMHSPILSDVEGISLERVSFYVETNLETNWMSASSAAGYGTPGYKNSQFEASITKPKIVFTPESFSPNGDGYNDFYRIQYQLEKPGYIMNLKIFDSAGNLIVQLAKNEILGTSGEINWNGEDETGQLQTPGIYVLMLEIFDLNGTVFRYKDGVVLTVLWE